MEPLKGLKRTILDALRSILKIKFFETSFVVFIKGKPYGSSVTKLTPNHYSYRSPSWRSVNRFGLILNLDISKLVDWFAYFYFKDNEHEWLIETVKPGFVVVDVGANIGILSLRMGNKVKPDGRVLAYEPFPATFNRLQKHISQNKLQQWVKASQIALGSKSGKSEMREIDIRNPGMNRIVIAQPDSQQGTGVEVDSLDNQFEVLGLDKLNGIKIDVEGYEYEVLIGAKNTIQKHKPFLFIELDNDNLKEQGSSAAILISLLQNWGYKIRHASTSVKLSPTDTFDHCHYDVICEAV